MVIGRSMVCVASAVLLMAGAAAAQEAAQTTPATDAPPVDQGAETAGEISQGGRVSGPPPFTFTITPKGEHTFESSMRRSDAEVSISRAGANLDFGWQVRERLRLTFGVEGEASWYNFSNFNSILPNALDPIDDAYLVRFAPGVRYGIDDRWSVLLGGIIEFAGDRDVSLGDAATYGGFGGVGYRVSDDLFVTAGVIVKSRLEDDVLVVPLLGVRWQINDRLSLENETLGLRFSAKASDQLTASIFARYEIRDYRLSDQSSIPDGVLEDSRIPVGATLKWSPSRNLAIAFSAGAIVWQRYEFKDSNGDDVANDRTRPAAFVGLSAEISF
ncbi:MAG: porin family protein [Phycisphaerales bacterium]|nr:porin family protein [Phycisphaerales bacterium]